MKKYIVYSLIFTLLGVGLTACSEDKLDEKSVISNPTTPQNQFDKWLQANYLEPYNIEFIYRHVDNELDRNYVHVPSNYLDAVKLAHIVKYTCIEAYDQVAGISFMRSYFPKMIITTGEFEYRQDGTIILGTAESGKKIFLAGINHLDQFSTNLDDLNTYYLKTIHHEFTHILHQMKAYPTDYKLITGNLYISDAWSQKEGQGYLQRGFITAYSQKEDREDFAEMLSTYVTTTPQNWAQLMAEASKDDKGNPTDGATIINRKLEMVRTYLHESWNIDIDLLRDEVLRRELDVIQGRLDLTDLTVIK